MKTISVARLREVLNYDPETGIFTWKVRLCLSTHVGDVAGCKNAQGYYRIGIDGTSLRAHRAAIAYVEGKPPVAQVDHINGNRLDNRYCNLRHATQPENCQNRGVSGNNTSGYTGVYFEKDNGRWRARISLNGARLLHLGTFDTPEEASAAYLAAKAQLHTFQPTQR